MKAVTSRAYQRSKSVKNRQPMQSSINNSQVVFHTYISQAEEDAERLASAVERGVLNEPIILSVKNPEQTLRQMLKPGEKLPAFEYHANILQHSLAEIDRGRYQLNRSRLSLESMMTPKERATSFHKMGVLTPVFYQNDPNAGQRHKRTSIDVLEEEIQLRRSSVHLPDLRPAK